MRKAAGAIVGAALLFAACGDDAPSALTGDDLASELGSVCRTATRAIGELDPEDGADYYTDVAELIDTAATELGDLPVDEKDASDVEDLVSLIEDEAKQMEDVADAADSGDAAALASAQADLAATSADADELASDLDAERCVGLGVSALTGGSITPAVTTTLPTTETTLPAESTLPATTLPTTTAAPITLPTTVPPTVPVTPAPTAPPATPAPGGSIITKNMIDNWNSPAGYTFEQESGDIFAAILFAPENVPSLAPSIVNYEAGGLAGDGGGFYVMIALELSADFSDDQISDWIDYEGTGPGDVQNTPGGLAVWVEPPSGDIEYTEYLWIIGSYGMIIRISDGTDGLAFVDAFTTANFE